jgi:3-phosphoshikimate 1-carboxyvinyltransferase
MNVTSEKSRLDGTATVPASKSHTIRAVIIGALADGESVVEAPLDSFDTRSAADAARAFGAKIETGSDAWRIQGVSGCPAVPDNIIDVGNSGTTLYMVMGTASLVDGWTVLTGDAQIRRRTAQYLMDSLEQLGAKAVSTKGNGLAPLMIRGPLAGGSATVVGVTSQ